jgi:uracil-DNA glycosylase family 4
MTVTSSQALLPATSPCKRKICKACGLYLNQLPVFDDQRISDVFWVGLSAVRFDDGQDKRPLSALTPSGSLVHKIEQPFKSLLKFYKTNLVKCVPMKADRIRYPLEHEMEKCLPNFEWEIEELKPKTVFLLGKQVATFVLKRMKKGLPSLDDDFHYGSTRVNGIDFVPIHHPSYILIYRRKVIDQYIKGIQRLFPL